jgi:oligopeptidase B
VDARNPEGSIRIVERRRSEVEYFVEHHDGFLYILTNLGPCPNYRLVRCPIQTPAAKHWQVNSTVLPGSNLTTFLWV